MTGGKIMPVIAAGDAAVAEQVHHELLELKASIRIDVSVLASQMQRLRERVDRLEQRREHGGAAVEERPER
jgi:uncharacterized protein HemX